MEKILNIQRELFRSTRSAWLVIGLTLLILGCAIASAQMVLRHKMRAQIARQEAELFQSVAQMQHAADAADGAFSGPPDDPDSYFDEVLKISKLRGVLGVRLFDSEGTFRTAFPSLIREATLGAEDLEPLKNSKPVSHFHPQAPLEDIDLLVEDGGTAAILEVLIALPDKAGTAQFIVQGESLASVYAQLDRNLFMDGGTIFLACGSLLALIQGLAFRRIQKMNRQLFEANRELTMTAKTSAIGAVAAHLIHGLRNPLSGLQSFVSGQSKNGGSAETAEWEAACATTERMQFIVNDVVRILQEQQAGAHYEVSVSELMDLTLGKVRPLAGVAGVRLEGRSTVEATLSSRDANLIALILENLLQNALQATPVGKSVGLSVMETAEALHFEVADQGSGMAGSFTGELFKPCRSTKPGGGGIGLAICQQLALQLNGRLALKSSAVSGCIFSLSLPKAKGLTSTAVFPV